MKKKSIDYLTTIFVLTSLCRSQINWYVISQRCVKYCSYLICFDIFWLHTFLSPESYQLTIYISWLFVVNISNQTYILLASSCFLQKPIDVWVWMKCCYFTLMPARSQFRPDLPPHAAVACASIQSWTRPPTTTRLDHKSLGVREVGIIVQE